MKFYLFYFDLITHKLCTYYRRAITLEENYNNDTKFRVSQQTKMEIYTVTHQQK